MTQDKIDSIQERMCDDYCVFFTLPQLVKDDICKTCPLNELKEEMPKWIPVTERLPEELGYYLTSTEYHDVLSDFFCDGKWETAERFWYNVAAWMPLPEPYHPKEGRE